MAMLQQMMGTGAGGMPGMPGGQSQPGGPGDLPPGLANMFSAMSGGGGASEPSPEQSSAWIWRLVHSLFSLGLAIYIVLQTPFTGSKLSRNTALTAVDEDWTVESTSSQDFAHFFYLFATFEVIMQSSRYFIEKGPWLSFSCWAPQPGGEALALHEHCAPFHTRDMYNARLMV